MTPRMGPDRDEVEYWIEFNLENIDYWQKEIQTGQADQGTYTSMYLSYISLGRARYLHGAHILYRDTVKEARAAFQKATECIEMSFRMAYDPKLPEYLGDQADWSCVMEGDGIDGFNAAFMATDFALARRFAPWPRRSPDDDPMDEDVCNYVDALQAYLLKDDITATRLLRRNFELFEKHKKRLKSGDEAVEEEAGEDHAGVTNYHTLSTGLLGIVEKNESRFNGGLAAQLEFYERFETGPNSENEDTPQEFICDNAVALANLGLWAGLKLRTQHRLMPPALLISTHPPISK